MKTALATDKLKQKIESKTATVSVIGMGYVGFAVAESITKAGFKFIGYDINKKRVEDIQKNTKGKINATTNINDIRDSDVILVCLPTPVKEYVHPDLSSLEDAINSLTNFVLKENQLLIIESTVQPGITRDKILPLILNRKKELKIGENFFLGYSPERVDPGSEKYSDIGKIPKIVSGISDNCLELTHSFYKQFIETLHKANSPEIAELAKLYENTFRAINIAFVGEMTRIANRLNINISEVLTAAYTKPFGILPFWPSVGVGGHCIPVDLLYLDSWARTNDCYSQFVELAHRTNQGMPYYILQRIGKILNEDSKPLKGSKVLQLGLAYKPNISDTRTSASVKLAELLVSSGAELKVYDPHVKSIDLSCKVLPKLDKADLQESDLVVFSVAHSDYDKDLILNNAKKVFECCGKPVFENNKKVLRL